MLEPSQTSLPSIGVFLSKSCTIPLVRCDFEHIKKTVDLQVQQDIHDKHDEIDNQPIKPATLGNSDNDKKQTSEH